MNELGERIKKLRKNQKMTLAELAGTKLTKGMLSLIENGKAQPSMDSLHYIAKQLGVEVTELLQDGHVEEIRSILLQVEERFQGFEHFYAQSSADDHKEMLQLIEPILPKLQGTTYEEIRLMDMYLVVKRLEDSSFPLTQMMEVIKQYETIHAYSRMVNCYSFLCWTAFTKRDYKQALKYLEESLERVTPHFFLLDNLTKLDLFYNLTALYAALGDTEGTERFLNEALAIAKNKKIYYRIDDFYRLIVIQSISEQNQQKTRHYLDKLILHAQFTGDETATVNALLIELEYLNHMEKDYLQVIKKVDDFYNETSTKHLGEVHFLKGEKAYAQWALGQFDEVLYSLSTIELPTYVHHPIDLSFIYLIYSVRALCHAEKGNHEEAKRDILYAVNGVENFPKTLYTQFIHSAYGKIMN